MIPGALTHFAAACSSGSFFGFPTWYEYLKLDPTTCAPQVTSLNDIWLIVAAGIEIMLRLAALVAFGFVVFAGVGFLTSQGEPEKTARARSTLANALIGLIIAVMAAVVVGFIAGSIK